MISSLVIVSGIWGNVSLYPGGASASRINLNCSPIFIRDTSVLELTLKGCALAEREKAKINRYNTGKL
jgi:hypothetical protein